MTKGARPYGFGFACFLNQWLSGEAEELAPLAVAVAKGNLDMVNALVAYGADPLIRLRSDDFPGYE
eukprot:6485252-Amphidinium_carterae.2